MAPLYKKALVVGATSGIGAALASKLIANGTKVVVVGRRRDRLQAFVKAYGSDVSSAVAFDVTNLNGIKAFADKIIQSNPDLDCIVISSGVQRGFNFSQPETVDLSLLGDELTTNYTSVVYLTTAFLPHLKKEPHGNIIYINATLGLIPAMVRTPNYNASKAALHAFVIDIRYQLRQAGYPLRIVEVFPPAVQTELHDEKHQPDIVNGGEIGMPLAEFIDQMYDGLVKGSDQFAVGLGEDLFREGGWEYQRGQMCEAAQDYFKDALAQYLRK
ncbi:related to dehydrogenase [Fusarium torulosum]|uniref:Related to dehydrogenase n=1 Tax=Fusarium torulosum TaxID=33205 RepID=A0AAE8SQ52_9HYPO|nr:related to dehydrogenase [Fusarium torulosum]